MTEPWFEDGSTTVFHGDSIDVLRSLPSNTVDSVCTDPPYGLADLPVKKVTAALTEWLTGDRAFIPDGSGFMSNRWDRFVPPPALWDEVFRVMKPGAYLMCFAGTRTQDLMGMSIRLAGFKVTDQAQWVRSDSFPKTKHTLKPGYEPILMAQKPLDGTIAHNIERWGTGGLNIDAVRTAFRNAADETESKAKNRHGKFGTKQGGNTVFGDYSMLEARKDYDAPGRWPTNIMFDEVSAAELDAHAPASSQHGDAIGGPSRFYPVFAEDAVPFHYAGRATVKERPDVDGVKHPTVKPLSVMTWMAKLVTPAGGTVLDPFLGSGTTVEAARLAGIRSIGVEASTDFTPLIRQRLERSAP